MREEWRNISGYEGIYQISNKGNIRSLNYQNSNVCKNLSKKINNKGYEHVILYKNGIGKSFLVHRLVAIEFIERKEGLDIVNHKDENPLNNNVNNLEWCDYKYNSRYYFEKHKKEFSEKIKANKTGKAIKNKNKIAQISLDGKIIRIFDNSISVEKELGFFRSSIIACCNKKRKTAHNYRWEFIL